MRNRKNKSTILYRDDVTGEFVARERFNGHDYYMTSVFDDENNDFDRCYGPDRPRRLYESFFDNCSSYDGWDDIIASNDIVDNFDYNYKIEVIGGGTHELKPSEMSEIDSFFNYISKHIIMSDKADLSRYVTTSDIVSEDERGKSLKLIYSRMTFINGNVRFVIGNDLPTMGTLYLRFNADYEMSFIIEPRDAKLPCNLYGKDSVMSFRDFTVVSMYEGGGYVKNIPDYYETIVNKTISMLSQAGVFVTLAKNMKGGNVNPQYFTYEAVDNAFPRKNLKAMTQFGPGREGNRAMLSSVLEEDMDKITEPYNNSCPLNLNEVIKDDYYVVLTKGNNFANKLRKSAWYNNVIHPDSLVYMYWTDASNVKVTKNHAIAMPLTTFAVFAQVFYYFLMHDRN